MAIRKTKDFFSDFNKLPDDAKKIFAKQESIFIQNWLDSRLHIKKLKDLEAVYSLIK